MNRTPRNTIPQTRNDDLHYYMELIALVATGPTVLSAYVFAVCGLTANIGLTNSFPWSAGPRSNWMIWLGLALLLNLLALREGFPYIRVTHTAIDRRRPLSRAELTATERPLKVPDGETASQSTGGEGKP